MPFEPLSHFFFLCFFFGGGGGGLACSQPHSSCAAGTRSCSTDFKSVLFCSLKGEVADAVARKQIQKETPHKRTRRNMAIKCSLCLDVDHSIERQRRCLFNLYTACFRDTNTFSLPCLQKVRKDWLTKGSSGERGKTRTRQHFRIPITSSSCCGFAVIIMISYMKQQQEHTTRTREACARTTPVIEGLAGRVGGNLDQRHVSGSCSPEHDDDDAREGER